MSPRMNGRHLAFPFRIGSDGRSATPAARPIVDPTTPTAIASPT